MINGLLFKGLFIKFHDFKVLHIAVSHSSRCCPIIKGVHFSARCNTIKIFLEQFEDLFQAMDRHFRHAFKKVRVLLLEVAQPLGKYDFWCSCRAVHPFVGDGVSQFRDVSFDLANIHQVIRDRPIVGFQGFYYGWKPLQFSGRGDNQVLSRL